MFTTDSDASAVRDERPAGFRASQRQPKNRAARDYDWVFWASYANEGDADLDEWLALVFAEGGPISELFETVLKSIPMHPSALHLAGPDLWIGKHQVAPLRQLLEDVGAASAEVGAWSTLSGRVQLTWDKLRRPSGTDLRLFWREFGVDGHDSVVLANRVRGSAALAAFTGDVHVLELGGVEILISHEVADAAGHLHRIPSPYLC